MENLILDSLDIRNFRAFEHLTIERLGRVNLITGKNGVGKTALLEAIWLYAQRGTPASIIDLLVSHDELKDKSDDGVFREYDDLELQNLRFLFHGREEIGEQTISSFRQSGSELLCPNMRGATESISSIVG